MRYKLISKTWLLGVGLLLCFSALSLLYLNVPPGFTQPPFWSPRPNHSVEVSRLYRHALMLPDLSISAELFHWLNLLLILLSLGAYTTALYFTTIRTLSKATLAITLLLILALLPMPPLYATDVFYYAISGQIAGPFGGNPYVQSPDQFPQSLFLPYNYWINITTPYGPVWTLLSSAVVVLTGGSLWLTTIAFKLVAAISVALTGWLIWKLLRDISPDFAAKGTLIFLWNPIVLLETAGTAHNEAPMVACTLAAALFLFRRATTSTFVCLLLATFMKYLVGPLLVFYTVARLRPSATAHRERVRMFAVLVGLTLIVTIIVWAPYWEGLRTLSSLATESSRGLSGLTATAIQVVGFRLSLPNTLVRAAARIGSLLALAAVGVWLLWRLVHIWYQHHTFGFTDELRDWAYVMLLVPITMPRGQPWYLLTAMALFAVVAPQARKGALVTYILVTAWFIYRACYW